MRRRGADTGQVLRRLEPNSAQTLKNSVSSVVTGRLDTITMLSAVRAAKVTKQHNSIVLNVGDVAWLGGTVVEHRTRDRKVAGLTPVGGAIKSTGSTQPSIPLGQVN